MNLIRPTCRNRFTPADIEFILDTLAPAPSQREALKILLGDSDSLDQILDDDQLFHALMEYSGLLAVSGPFYFYVLVRHVLREAGCEDRELADYTGALLAEFSSSGRMRRPLPSVEEPLDYLVDMLRALRSADESTRFLLTLHLGNYALFLSGIFSDYIEHRARRRGAPGLSYYEAMGSGHYQAASGHRLARKFDLTVLLEKLSVEFRPTRRALTGLADRLLIWDETARPNPTW